MSSAPPPENPKLLPQWAVSDFQAFLDKNERLTHVLRLSMGGIAMIRGVPKAIQALAKFDNAVADSADKLRRAEADRDLAQREVDHDFPLLHEQATIALWSSLEALVRSFLATWLANRPDAWQVDAVKKQKVRLGDFMTLGPLERCLWVVDLVDQEAGGPLRQGVTRFESLLEPFGLSGPLDQESQRTLFELSQVRHALVHRSGIVDKKLVEACPWLDLKAGSPLLVSHAMWHRYNRALGAYVLELVQRVRVYFGVGRYEPPQGDA